MGEANKDVPAFIVLSS